MDALGTFTAQGNAGALRGLVHACTDGIGQDHRMDLSGWGCYDVWGGYRTAAVEAVVSDQSRVTGYPLGYCYT